MGLSVGGDWLRCVPIFFVWEGWSDRDWPGMSHILILSECKL